MMNIGVVLAMPAFVLLIIDIVAFILVIIGVRGSARILAAIGVAVQVVSFVASTFFSLMLARVVHDFQLGLAQMRLLSLIVNLVTALIVAIGLVMIGLAIGPQRNRVAGARA